MFEQDQFVSIVLNDQDHAISMTFVIKIFLWDCEICSYAYWFYYSVYFFRGDNIAYNGALCA